MSYLELLLLDEDHKRVTEVSDKPTQSTKPIDKLLSNIRHYNHSSIIPQYFPVNRLVGNRT